MINLVSLLAVAALVSLQCGLEAHLVNSKLDMDNNLQPNVVTSPKRQIRKYVHIIQAPPETVEHVVGETLLLECQVYGAPSPSVTWLRNGEPVSDFEEDSNEIISPHPSSFAQLTSKLVVTTPSNGDVFTCLATAGIKQESASTTVYTVGDENAHFLNLENLYRLPSKPVITATYNDVIQEIGTNVLLPCRVYSHSKTQVEWMDNHEKLVYGNSRFRVLPSGDLLIMGIRWSDMGEFVCTVKNLYGKDSAVSFLYTSRV